MRKIILVLIAAVAVLTAINITPYSAKASSDEELMAQLHSLLVQLSEQLQLMEQRNLAAIATPTTSPSITVVSPNGGEQWIEDAPQIIKWSSNISKDVLVNIYLVRYIPPCPNGKFCPGIVPMQYTLDVSTLNDGVFEWNGSKNIEGLDIPTDQYIVSIGVKDSGPGDKSDAPFSIVATNTIPSITVLSPNGGEQWKIGSRQLIKWTSKGVRSSNLLTVGLISKINDYVLASDTTNDGREYVTIPGFLPPGSYLLTIKTNVNGIIIDDWSDQSFQIVKKKFTRYLYKGVFGEDVRALQELLKAKGYFSNNEESTGYFGMLTVTALEKYQADNGLGVTGTLGPQTRAKINSEL